MDTELSFERSLTEKRPRIDLIALNMRGKYGPLYAASHLYRMNEAAGKSARGRSAASQGLSPDWAGWETHKVWLQTEPVTDTERQAAYEEEQRAADDACTILTWADDNYPPFLRHVPWAPPVIYVKGAVEALSVSRAVGIVGTRRATADYTQAAYGIAKELGQRGIAVVSGLARGVDGWAHRGCMEGGGITVAVLAHGLHTVYPGQHRKLAGDIVASRGAVISFFPYGTPPRPFHFPARNWVIAGLSAGVVVVQGGLTSGAMITADAALAIGKEVGAMPGPAGHPLSEGPHALLRSGAALVEKADDVLASVFGDIDPSPLPAAAVPGETDAAVAPLLARLAMGPMHIDDFTEKDGISPQQAIAMLTELEMEGRVYRDEHGRYALNRWGV